MTFQNPDESEIATFLKSIKHIAVLGLSPKPARPSHNVAMHLQDFGYHIIPVRPAIDSVLGEPAFATLEAASSHFPGQIDLVDVFRAPEYVDEIVDTCIKLNLPAIWLQDGVINKAAAVRAQQAGLFVVMDRCIYRDYVNLLG